MKIDDEVKIAVIATEAVRRGAERTNADIGKQFTKRRLEIAAEEIAQTHVQIRHGETAVKRPHLRLHLSATRTHTHTVRMIH